MLSITHFVVSSVVSEEHIANIAIRYIWSDMLMDGRCEGDVNQGSVRSPLRIWYLQSRVLGFQPVERHRILVRAHIMIYPSCSFLSLRLC